MSLRNIKKLQCPENLLVQTESDEDSEEISRLKKNSSNKFGGFDLVWFSSLFTFKFISLSIQIILTSEHYVSRLTLTGLIHH